MNTEIFKHLKLFDSCMEQVFINNILNDIVTVVVKKRHSQYIAELISINFENNIICYNYRVILPTSYCEILIGFVDININENNEIEIIDMMGR